jgi:hypothetical protein
MKCCMTVTYVHLYKQHLGFGSISLTLLDSLCGVRPLSSLSSLSLSPSLSRRSLPVVAVGYSPGAGGYAHGRPSWWRRWPTPLHHLQMRRERAHATMGGRIQRWAARSDGGGPLPRHWWLRSRWRWSAPSPPAPDAAGEGAVAAGSQIRWRAVAPLALVAVLAAAVPAPTTRLGPAGLDLGPGSVDRLFFFYYFLIY